MIIEFNFDPTHYIVYDRFSEENYILYIQVFKEEDGVVHFYDENGWYGNEPSKKFHNKYFNIEDEDLLIY